jgi:hypothetical protein
MENQGPIIPDWPPRDWLDNKNSFDPITLMKPWPDSGKEQAKTPEDTGGFWQDVTEYKTVPMLKKKPEPIDPILLTSEARNYLAGVEELYFSGGGAAGGALPAAIEEAVKLGLDLKNVKRVVAASVGVFVAMAIALEIPADQLQELLDDMPRGEFQDWELWQSLNSFAQSWGWCKGEVMTDYFRRIIKERTGLEDPTFRQLYEAGFTKELCIVTTNLSQGSIGKFSYIETPDKKIAEVLTLACSVPIVYPPKWVVNSKGERELHTDGGIINNYPWGVGSSNLVANEKRLGFVFVNKAVGFSMDGIKNVTDSFLKYIGQVFWTFIFRHPLSLGDDVKRRTVAIQVDHNPLKFQPNEEQQAELSKAGRKGVQNLVRHNLLIEREGDQKKFWDMSHLVDSIAEPREKLEKLEPGKPIIFKELLSGSTKLSLQPEHRDIVEAGVASRARSAVCAPAA